MFSFNLRKLCQQKSKIMPLRVLVFLSTVYNVYINLPRNSIYSKDLNKEVFSPHELVLMLLLNFNSIITQHIF